MAGGCCYGCRGCRYPTEWAVAKGGLVKSRDRWFLGSMMMGFGGQKSQNKNPHAGESCQRIYRDDNTNKAVGDRDAFGNCVFQKPTASVLIYKRKNLQWLRWELPAI